MEKCLRKYEDRQKSERDNLAKHLDELRLGIENGRDLNYLKVELNLQDGFGQEALYFAASSGDEAKCRDIAFVLENFDDIDVTIQDEYGDTFLHCYFKSFEKYIDIDLLSNILDGKYKCCSDDKLTRLLQLKNKSMHSAFHLYFLYAFMTEIKICEKFLKAGADMNTCNNRGENVLHHLHTLFGDTFDVVEYLIPNGANVNQQNVNLDTPLHTTASPAMAKHFLRLGADVKLQNNVGQTPLMAMVTVTPYADVVEMCLEKDQDVNKADKFGSTCLHYAAWANTDVSIVKLLKKNGAIISEDINGNLPCTIAQKRGYKVLVVELCQCENGAHKDIINLNSTREHCLKELLTIKSFSGGQLAGTINISKLLKTPFTGAVTFVDEADELNRAVIDTVTRICNKIGEKDALLENTVILSGSVSEDTKVGLPNEFDFCCLIDRITEAFEVDKMKSSKDHDYAYLRLKENHIDSPLRQMLDSDGYIIGNLVMLRFMNVLREVLDINLPTLMQNQKLRFKPMLDFSTNKPNCCFVLTWIGSVYKKVNISIDLVPACQVPGWWPHNTQIDKLQVDSNSLLNHGAICLLQSVSNTANDPMSKLRVSANIAEKQHMLGLPQIARDAYATIKILQSKRFCPNIKISETQHNIMNCIKSYYIKTCMFHTFQGNFLQDMKSLDYKGLDAYTKEERLKQCVVRILDKLVECTESGFLQGFVFPWQNIFTFSRAIFSDVDDKEMELKRDCAWMKIYVLLMLNLIGQDVDFSDINIEYVEYISKYF